MIFKRQAYSQKLIDEMMPLWEAHQLETANKFYGPLDPNFEVYAQCEANGLLRIYTARQGGELAGYQIFVVSEHPHSKDMVVATQDILYLRPAYRRGLTGFNFMKWCMNELTNDGVHIMHQVVPARLNLGGLFERLGFELEDVNFSKRLQEVS